MDRFDVWSRTESSFNTTCFLTAVGGRFEGGGEYVQVAIESGRWILRGQTQQATDIHASALCIGVAQSTSGTWSKGQGRKFLQHGGSCFLTRVSGKFVGGNESVTTFKDSNGDWQVSGGSTTSDTISATATCVPNEPLSTGSQWASTAWSVRMVADGHPATKACFLQGMKGGFRGAGEEVSTSHGPTANYWYLNGQSNSASSSYMIGGTAGCIGD